MYLSLDRNLVGGDEVVRCSSFSACCDGSRGCHSAILRGDHHCDVVWWSKWSELGGAARDVVNVVWWSRWSELGGAARDVVWWSRWSELSGLLDGLCGSLARRGSLSGSTWLVHQLGQSSSDAMMAA